MRKKSISQIMKDRSYILVYLGDYMGHTYCTFEAIT